MVKGLDRFRDHFSNFGEYYVLIGGTACDLAFSAVGLEFRATRDIDIVLMVERLDDVFGQALMDFVETGGYEHRQHAGDKDVLQFYRFTNPERDDFPSMLELFSRKPSLIRPLSDGYLTPIPFGEDMVSLSAILIDDDYYSMIQRGRTSVDGVSTLTPEALIPLKARAWLDLTIRKESGEEVDSKDIKKHKNDVFRLLTLLTEDMRVALPRSVRKELTRFLEAIESAPPDFKALGLTGLKFEDAADVLRQIYFDIELE